MVERYRPKRQKFGGRVKGTPNRKTLALNDAVKKAGVSPKEFLINGMAHYQTMINEEVAQSRPDQSKIAKLYLVGKEFAKDVAPYCHPKLQSVEHKGEGGGPIQYQEIRRVIVRPKPQGEPANKASAP